MAVASGGETGTREEEKRSGGPVVDLQPNVETIQVWSNILRTFMVTKSSNVYYITTNPILV